MYIVEARKIGAEPSITVRLTGSTPEKASALVRYVNIEKGYGVKYWAIGNEPDLYVTADQSWNAERYAKQWRDFATAMKAVDPTISFYGPDISNFVGDADKFDPLELLYVNSQKINETKRDYLIEFLKVNADLVNIVTVHRYPFPKKSSDGLPTWEQLRDNTAEWDRIIPNLRRVIKETTGKDYPVGVMEYNSHTSNSAGASTSPDSFYNALWVADIYGRMIRQRPEMQAYWLVKNNEAGHGLLTSFAVRPPYYAFAMWKKFGNHLLTANSDTQYVSVYAAKAEDGAVTVMLINLNGTETRKPLQLNGGDQLKLAEAFLFDAEHNAEAITPPEFKNGDGIVLPAESVMLLIFR
jgi:alpha-L-arabinofuranosidase